MIQIQLWSWQPKSWCNSCMEFFEQCVFCNALAVTSCCDTSDLYNSKEYVAMWFLPVAMCNWPAENKLDKNKSGMFCV